MDDRTWLGNLAEIRTASELVRQRFEVFQSTTGKAPFDLVAYKNDLLLRIEVRGTSFAENKGSYSARLCSTRGTTGDRRHKDLDCSIIDLLAVYVEPWDEVTFIASCLIKSKTMLTFRQQSLVSASRYGYGRLMSDGSDAWKVYTESQSSV